LTGVWSEIYRSAFRDSILRSAAEVGTRSTEHLEDGSASILPFLNVETLTGYDDGSGGGNPSVGGFNRHLRDRASRAI